MKNKHKKRGKNHLSDANLKTNLKKIHPGVDLKKESRTEDEEKEDGEKIEEELDESLYWMELLIEAKILTENLLNDLMKEGNELLSIIVSSIMTAKSKSKEFVNLKS